jgi:hypothetical protein
VLRIQRDCRSSPFTSRAVEHRSSLTFSATTHYSISQPSSDMRSSTSSSGASKKLRSSAVPRLLLALALTACVALTDAASTALTLNTAVSNALATALIPTATRGAAGAGQYSGWERGAFRITSIYMREFGTLEDYEHGGFRAHHNVCCHHTTPTWLVFFDPRKRNKKKYKKYKIADEKVSPNFKCGELQERFTCSCQFFGIKQALLGTDGSFFVPWTSQEEYGYGIGKDSSNILFQLIRKIRLDESGGLHNASMDDIREERKWQRVELKEGLQADAARISGAREQEIQDEVARTRKFDTNKQNRLEKKNERELCVAYDVLSSRRSISQGKIPNESMSFWRAFIFFAMV